MKPTDKKIEQVATASLVPYAKNAKKHDAAQVAAIAGSIREFGFNNPVLIDADNGIIAGHGRVLAAHQLGLERVPCLRLTHLTDTQKRAYILADNRLAEIGGGWDAEMLAAELESLSAEGITMEEIGFDADALEELGAGLGDEGNPEADAEPQIDKAEELRAKWGVEIGQTWELGEHRLLCGDSTDQETVTKFMGQEKADVVFTDPPYGVNIRGGKNNKTIAGDITQTAIPFAFAIACEQATTDDARLYFCGGEGNIGLYSKLFEKYCRQLPRHLIWVKNGFTMKPNGYHNQYEIIFHGYKPKGGGLNKWFGARTEDAASDVWQIKRDASATYLHPTQKPVDVPKRAIGNSCPPKGIVFEPFSGSASTLMACEQLGRKCRAIELDPDYVAVGLQRWADATGKTPKLVS
jgi:DNA modification methylase